MSVDTGLTRLVMGMVVAVAVGAGECRWAVAGQVTTRPATDYSRLLEFDDYHGSLGGDLRIRMTLYRDGASLAGTYFYERWLTDIRVEGEERGLREITLREYDAEGRVAGVFHGRYAEGDPEGRFRGPLQREIITGTWTNADGRRSLPFTLRMVGGGVGDPRQGRYAVAGFDDDAEVERGAKDFQAAVRNGDARAAADRIGYPIRVELEGRTVVIANKGQFARNFDAIFDRRFRKVVCEAVPHAMSAKWSGVMLGESGEIWFVPDAGNGRVMVGQINRDAPAMRGSAAGR